MRPFLRSFLTAAIVVCSAVQGQAQFSLGGSPRTFEPQFDQTPIVSVTMPPFDVAAMIAEDDTMNGKGLRPFRFGYNHLVSIDPQNSGSWITLSNGDRIWRLLIQSPDAFSINLGFSYFNLPVDAKMYVFSTDRQTVYGAFTHQNNNADNVFATDLVPGSAIIVEYFEPAHVSGQGGFVINRVTHAYHDVFGVLNSTRGFGDAGNCQFNSVCSLSAGWEEQIRSSVMLVSGGNGFCSGALINNTANDGKPYVLTADHCMDNGVASYVFRFRWESKTCPNPTSAPLPRSTSNPSGYFSYTGAILRASNAGSDFALLEMTGIPGNQFAPNDTVYFSGWNRNNTAASAAYGIHHPSGDIKKFSIANNATISSTYAGASCWRVGTWTSGCTEPGSSGSPLYDENKRIVGQLFGGPSYCGAPTSQLNDYYGKLATSWNGTQSSNRLKDWLDPLNAAPNTLDGFDPLTPQFTIDASPNQVISPAAGSSTCSNTISPEIKIRNAGATALTSLTIVYRANTGAWSNYNWTGNLNYNATANVVLPPIGGYADGNVTLTFKTSSPNAQIDQNTSNDSIQVSFTKLVTRDALPQSISSPAANYQSCVGSINPVFNLKNQGCDPLTSLTVLYRIDNNPNQNYTWTGNLSNGANVNVTLPVINGISAGSHTLTISMSNPNGSADQNTSNDQIVTSFSIVSATNPVAAPQFNGFEGSAFPGQGFSVINPNANNTWIRALNASGFGVSTASTRIDNFTSGAAGSGQSDYLLSPFLNFSNANSQLGMSFNYAYKQKTASNIDSLIVGISTNCGETWNTLWAKGGSSLSTTPGTSSVAFSPTPGQWASQQISLSAYTGQSDILIRFQAKSGGGNNIWLDDINIANNPLSMVENELPEFVLFPNPAENTITLTVKEPLSQATFNIRDIRGRIVQSFRLPENNATSYQIALDQLSNGIYITELQTVKGLFTQKLIIK